MNLATSAWLGLGALLCGCSSPGGSAVVKEPCPPAGSSQPSTTSLETSSREDRARVEAMNLPEAPGPCVKNDDCFADDPCALAFCIDGECTGDVYEEWSPCKPLAGTPAGGICYRGRCIDPAAAPSGAPAEEGE